MLQNHHQSLLIRRAYFRAEKAPPAEGMVMIDTGKVQ